MSTKTGIVVCRASQRKVFPTIFGRSSFSTAAPDNDSETSPESSVCPPLYGLTGNFSDAKRVFSNEAPNRWR